MSWEFALNTIKLHQEGLTQKNILSFQVIQYQEEMHHWTNKKKQTIFAVKVTKGSILGFKVDVGMQNRENI